MFKVVTGTSGPFSFTLNGISISLKPGKTVDLERYWTYDTIMSCKQLSELTRKRTIRVIFDSHITLPKLDVRKDTTKGLVELKEAAKEKITDPVIQELVERGWAEEGAIKVKEQVVQGLKDACEGKLTPMTFADDAPVEAAAVLEDTGDLPEEGAPVNDEISTENMEEELEDSPQVEVLENQTCEVAPKDYGTRELRRKTSNEIRDIAIQLGIPLENKTKVMLIRDIQDSVKGK